MKHCTLFVIVCAAALRVSAQGTWNLDGNFVLPGQFLGSTNFEAVEIWADSYRILRLEPDPGGAFAGNIVGGFISNRVEQPDSGGNVIVGGGFFAGHNVIRPNSRGNFIGAGSAHQIGPGINDGVIGGGFGNTVQSFNSFIGGGHFNTIFQNAADSSIVGGDRNAIHSNALVSVIAGGSFNTIRQGGAFIGGGIGNAIGSNSGYGIIVGGLQNSVENDAFGSFIGGGFLHTNRGEYSFIGGGYQNASDGQMSTVPGGYLNSALGDYSFAAGLGARALHEGTFVWADAPGTGFLPSPFFSSTSSNQFLVRAQGGVGINTPAPNAGLHIKKEPIPPGGTLALEGATHTYLTFFPDGVAAGRKGFLGFAAADTANLTLANEAARGHILLFPFSGNVGIGTSTPANKLHVAGGVTATSFNTSSDRHAKTNLQPVDVREVLAKVTQLPIARWTFKDSPDGEHMGPMAQDFHAAFGLGTCDTTITSVDPDGVALAAIQGLNQKLTEELQRRDSENADLKRELGELRQLIHSFSQKFEERAR